MKIIATLLLVAVPAFGETVATIDGTAVSAEQIDRAAGPRLKKLAAEEDRIRREVLRELIEERLRACATPECRDQVRILLDGPRLDIATAGRPSLGPSDAPVTIVVFSDFQCPYCKDTAEVLRRVQQAEGGRVRVVHRHFPLPSHPRAERIAEAAECAASLGRFWPVHDALFANTERVSDAELIAIAAEAGIDRRKFRRCLGAGDAKGAVEADVEAALEAGVDGTPALFINGRRVSGPRNVDALRRLIAEELALTATSPATHIRKETR